MSCKLISHVGEAGQAPCQYSWPLGLTATKCSPAHPLQVVLLFGRTIWICPRQETSEDAGILPKAAPDLRAKGPDSILAHHGVNKAALLRLDCGKYLCFSGGRDPNLPQHPSLLRDSLAPFSSSPAWKQPAPTAPCPLLLGMGCQEAARPRLFGALSHHCTRARCGVGGLPESLCQGNGFSLGCSQHCVFCEQECWS